MVELRVRVSSAAALGIAVGLNDDGEGFYWLGS